MMETIPPSASDIWTISGSTETNNDVEAASARILNLAAIRAQEKVRFIGPVGRAFQLQRADNLTTNTAGWINFDLPIYGTGGILEANHQGGTGLTQQFYRVKVIP